MRTGVSQTLDVLSRAFAVRDIMIAQDQLTRARTPEDAVTILSDLQCRFDVIPLPDSGPITSYITRESSKPKRIAPPMLVSDGTAILDLIDILGPSQPFAFVLARDNISGFVHYSDLNNPLVKLPFFVLMERVEAAVWSMIEGILSDTLLREVFDKERYQTIQIRIERATKSNVDLGFQGALYLDEMLTLACHQGHISISSQEKEAVSKVRSRIFHADKRMIDSQRDIKVMRLARDACGSIINDPKTDQRSGEG